MVAFCTFALELKWCPRGDEKIWSEATNGKIMWVMAELAECRDGALLFFREHDGRKELVAGFSLTQINHWGCRTRLRRSEFGSSAGGRSAGGTSGSARTVVAIYRPEWHMRGMNSDGLALFPIVCSAAAPLPDNLVVEGVPEIPAALKEDAGVIWNSGLRRSRAGIPCAGKCSSAPASPMPPSCTS